MNVIFVGLAVNETAPTPVLPTPVLPTPRVPSEEEKEQAVEMSIIHNSTVSERQRHLIMVINSLFASYMLQL